MPLSNCIQQTAEGQTVINSECMSNWVKARTILQKILPPGFAANNLNDMKYMYQLHKNYPEIWAKQVAALVASRLQNFN